MSNIEGLIRQQANAACGIGAPVDPQVLIDALWAEHAEVESLQGALSATDDFRIADWQKLEAERDDAESEVERLRGEVEAYKKYLRLEREAARQNLARAERMEAELLRARAIPELLRHENARLTAQLQASKDVYAQDVYGWRDKATESLARAERAEAELGMVEQRYSAYDRQIETLTAQVQAVRETLSKPIDLSKVRDTPEGRALWQAVLANEARAILDAAADGATDE